ncbi:hypothetical protein K9B32_28335 [Rhizobium sp. 3T7]|uniref:hypothetical protein n=1 Tax=Rhizobium sp. 3T7 TaxID=2874922 RepID=UPI001CCDD42D|nr:hypothetical protein [Rhizobium sp. 3T7]MBZ9793957.1 hypothetical protein [Rhizobium sp. 3T7]
MKAAGKLNWDKIRDWLDEAGSICSGFYVEYRESRRHHQLSSRRPFNRPEHPAKAGPTISWVVSNRET